MKRYGFWLVALLLGAAPIARAQDAATEQRLKELSGRIESLVEGQEALRTRIDGLTRELGEIREQMNKPQAVYATPEELRQEMKRLTDAVNEAINKVDKKRIEDNQKIRTELVRLIDDLNRKPLPKPTAETRITTPPPEKPATDPSTTGSYLPYTIAKGDSLSAIVAACREKGIKVTEEQILRANKGLKRDLLVVGKKIRIPVPDNHQ